ncbi:histone H1-like [Heterodontus francisci]|uniref:histone H1-like n=1 Tax=Heterodontus francisci TaxID=7792 RepID=UPI00355C28C0
MADNSHKGDNAGDSCGGGGGVGGGGGGGATPPQGRSTPEKGAAKKKKKQQQQQNQQQQQQQSPQPQRRKKQGPTVTQRILQVAAATKERRGISLAALKKALSAKGYDVSRNNTRVNRTVKQLVRNGSLVQTAGVGASGSFRFNRSGAVGAAPRKERREAARRKMVARRPLPPKRSPRSKKRGAGRKAATAAAAAAKPKKGARVRRKPRFAARRGPAKSVRVRLKSPGARGKPARLHRKYKPVRGNRRAAGNIHRGRSLATKVKRPIGRSKKVKVNVRAR